MTTIILLLCFGTRVPISGRLSDQGNTGPTRQSGYASQLLE